MEVPIMSESGVEFRRYGIYVVPEGAFHAAGAAWLGWDMVRGTAVAHPDLPGLPGHPADLTATPRKYGFHGTVKPPFRLAEGTDPDALGDAVAAFCAARAPVEVPALAVRRLGGFVAVVPDAPCPALSDLAAAAVAALDPFRAAPDAAELARRRRSGLTERQEALLQAWGYPYVMEEFRFHLTLTGKLPVADADTARAALAAHFAPVLPRPFRIASLCLVGEDAEGLFHLVHRYTLSG
jgi:putative phosphonate metabolism protein